MKKFLLFISFCLMATIFNVASAAEEVLWAEDFSSYAANDVPTGGTYNYACTGTGTKVYTSNILAGAPSDSPELLIAKNGGTFSATIPLKGKTRELTLYFYTNSDDRVTVSATGATVGTHTYSDSKLCTYKVTVTEGIESITLSFTNTNAKSNVRFDDVKLVKIIEGPTKPALAVFTDENNEVVTGGDVKQGSYINYSWESGCSAKVYYNDVLEKEYTATEPSSGSWYVDAKKYAVGAEVNIKIEVTNEIGTTTATATFTVTNPYKVVDVITVDNIGATSGYNIFKNKIINGAEYAGRCTKNIGIQIGSSSNAIGTAIYMTQSVGKVTKIILDINAEKSSESGLISVFGKDTPYVAYSATGTTKPSTNEAYAYNSDESKIGKAIETEIAVPTVPTVPTEPYVIENPGYNYIIIVASGTVVFNSITFEWEDAFQYGKDIKYEMQSETTKLTAGKFVTLVDATNKIAVSRNNAAEGTIAGAAASIAEADENSNTSLYLGKGQFSIDEFELVPVLGGGFKLYGGGSITRRYIGVDKTATGLTTTAKETEAAVVTLESDGTGVVVKFDNGDIIVSDGTNFGKGTLTGTEAPVSLAEGKALVPAYVFVSPGEDSTGVEDIEMVETEAPAQYYNLNGVEVKAGNLVPGIYIVRQGNKVSKQFIR